MIRAQAIAAGESFRVADYLELCKPRLTLMVVLTTGFGYYLASGAAFDWGRLASALLGAGLAAVGVAALNMVIEREADGLMRRTRRRPVPSGRIAAGEALAFGALTAAAGVLFLTLAVDPLAGLLTAVTVLIYLFVYTPLKRLSPLSTPVGAVAGALPPLIGWSAAGHGLSLGAWVLFAVLFLWQLPHFLAIAWLFRDDYARAGMPMLSVVEPDGASTGRQMVLNTVALIIVSLAPVFWWGAGMAYGIAVAALGMVFLGTGVAFWIRRSRACARGVFVFSLVYLPALLALMATV